MNDYSPAKERTMYFIGVTTGKSSIMKVFPQVGGSSETERRHQGI